MANDGSKFAKKLTVEKGIYIGKVDGTGTPLKVIDENGNINVGTSIKFGDGEYIEDTNDNELIKFGVTASAVNEVTVTNAATGGAPTISATGGDTNINLQLAAKGTGGIQLDNTENILDANGNELIDFGATASAVNHIAISNDATGSGPNIGAVGDDTNIDLNIDAKGTGIIQANAKIGLDLNGGAASASGLLLGVGTTANPATSSTADDKFIEVRAETTATSGDNRLAYFRYALNGAGAGGECIRAFTKLTAAGGTVRGAHISLDIDAGSASGLGVGTDSQILLGDAALTGGTYAVSNIEAYSAGSSTDISGVTAFAFQRFSLGGDATGIANVDDNASLFSIVGNTIGAGNIVQADTDETKFSHKIRIDINGTTYYLMATAT